MALSIHAPGELQDFGGNAFAGVLPRMTNSTITFADGARNNIIYCEDHVHLVNSSIQINGSNSVIFLGSSRYRYLLTVSIHNGSVLHIGRNNAFTTNMHILLSEQKHCFIGDDGLFSIDVWIRNADPHLIYSCDTKQRLNPTRSVFIGDHVWLGQNARILKGTQIDSGSIVGGSSVVAGKKIGANASWAGNPCKLIKSGIFWDRACVHAWLDEDTQKSQDWNQYRADLENVAEDAYIFAFDAAQTISYDEMDARFSQPDTGNILAYLKSLPTGKNRFVHQEKTVRKSFWQGLKK